MDDANKCSICYDACANDLEAGGTGDRMEVKTQTCDHFFCRGCLVKHCKHAIQSRDIPISCPAAPRCRQKIREAQVGEILSGNADTDESITNTAGTAATSSYWLDFQRIMKKMLDPNLIECPKCGELFKREFDSSCEHVSDLTCPSCKHFFCAVHGDAHPTISCKMYKPTMTTMDIESERIIRRLTKPCSHCGIAIYKEGGCDHIICASCKEDMCFKCASHEYLSGDMIRSCSKCNQEYVDHRQLLRYRMAIGIRLAVYIPLVILQMIWLMVMVGATCGCCCCMFCGLTKDEDDADETNDSSLSSKFRPIRAIKEVMLLPFHPIVAMFPFCRFVCCGYLDGHSEDDFDDFETHVGHGSMVNTDKP